MNLIKNILKQYENSEMAEVLVSYCSIDDEYTVTLKTVYFIKTFVSDDVDKSLTEAYKFATEPSKGAI